MHSLYDTTKGWHKSQWILLCSGGTRAIWEMARVGPQHTTSTVGMLYGRSQGLVLDVLWLTGGSGGFTTLLPMLQPARRLWQLR